MSSSPIVSGFNGVANFLGATVPAYIPKKDVLAVGMSFLAKNLPADGLKTLVVKPLALVGQTLKYVNRADKFPILGRIAAEASASKALISALEVLTKLPNLMKNLSAPVNGPEASRQYRDINAAMVEGPELSPVEAVSNRLFHVANWAIAVGDAISYVRCYTRLPKLFEKMTPWIYTVAGGFMGLQTLWTEWKFSKGTWNNDKPDAVASEKYYSCLNLATSVAYLFSSATSAAGLYYKDQAPAWLGKYQFAANVGIVVMPAVQKCAKAYMENAVWA